jgi:predicted amidohydrolase
VIVAGLQLDIEWESPEENFARATALAEGTDARLLVLPEMFATGFSMDAAKVAPHAERIRAFLGDLALQRGAWVMGGYAEPGEAGGRPRNACSLYDPAGKEQLRYHKIHPFSLAREHEHYDGGSSLFTVEVEGVRVTPLICYDLRFPEPFRAAAANTDLFCVIANWPVARRDAWKLLLLARAVENQCFVLGVNRVGEGGGHHYSGDGALIDPFGQVVANATDVAAIIEGSVDARKVAAARENFSFLADRRPDVYRSL